MSIKVMVASPYGEGSSQAIARMAEERGNLHSYLRGDVIVRAARSLMSRRSNPSPVETTGISPLADVLYAGVRATRNATWSSRVMYWSKRRFDAAVAGHLSRLDPSSLPQVIVGMHGSSDLTFREAQRRGVTTVLNVVNSMPSVQNATLSRYGGGHVPSHEFVSPRCAGWVNHEVAAADRLLVPSRFVAAQFEPGDRDRLLRVPYGVDLSIFTAAVESAPPERLRVLCVGQVSWRKGVRTLLDAARGATDLADFELIGPVVSRGLLRGLPTNVTHRSTVTHEQLAELLRGADVFALLSWDDAYPLAVLEAMASGLPVVVTDNVGSRDLIRDGVNGFVVPVDDADRVVSVLRRLRDFPGLTAQVGRAARGALHGQHSWDDYGGRVLDAITHADFRP